MGNALSLSLFSFFASWLVCRFRFSCLLPVSQAFENVTNSEVRMKWHQEQEEKIQYFRHRLLQKEQQKFKLEGQKKRQTKLSFAEQMQEAAKNTAEKKKKKVGGEAGKNTKAASEKTEAAAGEKTGASGAEPVFEIGEIIPQRHQIKIHAEVYGNKVLPKEFKHKEFGGEETCKKVVVEFLTLLNRYADDLRTHKGITYCLACFL